MIINALYSFVPQRSIENRRLAHSILPCFQAGRQRGACDAGNLRLRFADPIYCLYIHAVELSLKAFLRTPGIHGKRLKRDFGRQHQTIWDECSIFPRFGQKKERCLPLIERALIRHFLSEGHDLVNVLETRLRQHKIKSKGAQHVMPKLMLLYRERKLRVSPCRAPKSRKL